MFQIFMRTNDQAQLKKCEASIYNFLRMSGEQGVSGRDPRGILRDKSISQCGCCYFQHPNPPFPGVTNSTAWAGGASFLQGFYSGPGTSHTHLGCNMLISVDTGWWLPLPSVPGPWQEPHQPSQAEVGTLPGAWISASLLPT